MCSMRNKRNSLPSLIMNKFFVSKRTSMFEVSEETPQEKRERSPCGVLETSEKKLRARKEKERKESMASRKKRLADPYAEESTEMEEEDLIDIVCANQKPDKIKKESRICGHATRSVNPSLVRRTLKNTLPIGECFQCRKAKKFSNGSSDNLYFSHVPVIWLCTFCGHQGCDRSSPGKHSFQHYKTPRSDPHCIAINTTTWTVWCYECDTEVIHTSSKKLHEVIQHVKRLSEMAPKKSYTQQLTVKPTNLITTYSGSDSRLHSRSNNDEFSKNARNQRNANALASLPKVKGISNLGNTCFFNSVIQSLAQTHFLTQLLDVQIQSGQRTSLPGHSMDIALETKGSLDSDEDLDDDDEDIELKPLDLYLPEGGSLSLAFSVFLKDMHSVSKNGTINPGHLFGQICKKSTQFQGYEQQDAHELLRCMLEAIKNEEVVRAKRAILKAFALSEKTDPNSVNSRLRKIIKGYGKQATHTIIDQIFGGQLLSTVFCEECHWSSQIFEPIMDLSLPINEEKGKPKKGGSFDDDSYLDCFGRSHNNLTNGSMSKHQLKKLRKNKRKNKRTDAPLTSIRIVDDDNEIDEKKRKRLTEKRTPEDEEEFRLRRESETKLKEEKKKKTKGESSRFRQLVEARKKIKDSEPDGSEEDESDEELEYDQEEDEEDSSLALCRRTKKLFEEKKKNIDDKRLIKEDELEDEEEEEEEEEDEEEEEEEEDEEEEEEEEEEETETNEGSDISSSVGSKSKKMSETSDADVEDNTDSEYTKNSCHNTRQPSIVVDTTVDSLLDADYNEADHRYLMTSSSCDQLNYNSCSDTSERYFTAAGADTMDELDHVRGGNDSPSAQSDRTLCSRKSSDRLSHRSGDGFDEICLKVGDMRISRKSSSRESLLEAPHVHKKRGSSEPLLAFNDKFEDEDDIAVLHKRNNTIKKLKQDWIAKSLTTLSPRYQSDRQECSVMSCLSNFTSPELLMGNNKIICENCNKLRCQNNNEETPTNVKPIKSNASKQLLIFSPPAVLTLHLKRFHHVGYNLAKVNRFVQFPLVLDIGPFTSSISLGLSNMPRGKSQVLYSLYGVVEHSGRLNSGHYVAYVRCRPLDISRISKQLLNLKPSSQFEINQLVNEMAEKMESDKRVLNGGFKSQSSNAPAANIKELEDEVKAGRWFFVSDAYVSEVTVDKVMKSQAYLLFYERVL